MCWSVFFTLQKTTVQVLIHLHRADYVAADKCVRESYRYVLFDHILSFL